MAVKNSSKGGMPGGDLNRPGKTTTGGRLYNNVQERIDSRYQQWNCDDPDTPYSTSCSGLQCSRKVLAPVGKNLDKVENPYGRREQWKNALGRRNRQDEESIYR